MMAQGPLRFSTIGKPILRTFETLNIFRFFNLPYGQGHGQGHSQGHGQGHGQGKGHGKGHRPSCEHLDMSVGISESRCWYL